MDWTGWISGLSSTLHDALSWVKDTLAGVARWALDHLKNVWGVLRRGILGIGRALRWLKNLRWRELWRLAKRAFLHLRHWLDWFRAKVYGPLDRMRRQLMEIYQRIFAPIIRAIDSLRVLVRYLAIFDRKLAARLDAALAGVETRLAAPIVAALRRINALSSHLRAMVTATGLLDRVMLNESLRRDASIVWGTLTNPRGLIYPPTAKVQPYTYADLAQDSQEYFKTNTGPVAEYVAAAQAAGREVREGVA